MYDLAVVVPARRGSSRIAEKCLLPFGDQPSLIEWKLAQLCQVIDPHRIYLSSEDAQFLSLGKRFGVSLHARDPRLAIGHEAAFSEVITGIIRDIPHDHIAWATVVCPLMSPAEYCTAFQAYEREVVYGAKDSLLGVNRAQEYFWSRAGALNYSANRDHTISQDLPEWFRVTNSLYMAPRSQMLARDYFLGDDPVLHELSKLAGIDLDYLEDYHIARALYALYREDGRGRLDPSSRIDWTCHAPDRSFAL